MTQSITLALNADGYADVPNGKVASIVTYLEMASRPVSAQAALPPNVTLEPIGRDLARYRRLFAAIGDPWLWFGRAVLDYDRLSAILSDAGVAAYAVLQDRAEIALIEERTVGSSEVWPARSSSAS